MKAERNRAKDIFFTFLPTVNFKINFQNFLNREKNIFVTKLLVGF